MPQKFLPLSWTGFAFTPFQVPDKGLPLVSLNLPANLELITVQRGVATRAFVVRELVYHHVAQGQLNGEPYIVSF